MGRVFKNSEERYYSICKQLFTPSPSIIELPYNITKVAKEKVTYVDEPFTLPKALIDRLQAKGSAENWRLSSALTAAYYALLYRYTLNDDFIVASFSPPHSMMMLRPALENGDNLQVLVKSVEDALKGGAFADGNEHRDFEKIFKEFNMSQEPEAVFSFREADGYKLPSSGARANATEVICATLPTGRYAWALQLQTSADGTLAGELSYDKDRYFAHGEAKLVAGHYVRMLELLAEGCATPVAKLNYLQAAEQERILKTYNDTAQSLPPCGVHQLFEECVRANPKAIALEFSDQAQGMTYEELNTRANRLAKHLLAAGIHKGDLVGVYLERTPNMIVALLAIQKSGAGYVPLDPLYPTERIQWMLEDSKAPVVLTTSDLSEHIGMPASPLPQPRLVCLDTEADFIASYDAKNPDVKFASADLMYVIFTSGSTGRPKGVQICHQSMVNFLLSFKSTMGVTASDALVAVTTVCFDIAGLELYLPLISGAKVVLAKRDEAGCPFQLASLIEKYQATILQATPATWRMLVASEWAGQKELKALCGGEPLPEMLKVELASRVSELWNVYGPTETTVWSTMACVAKGGKPIVQNVPIGRPIGNTTCYCLDVLGNLLPDGLSGELWIGGQGLSLGYLGHPDLTKDKFVACPFEAAGAKMYATGDVVTWNHSTGMLECIGRKDYQVKIRGFRIELGEIEGTLTKSPGVQQAVVEAQVDPQGDGTEKRLVAYLTMKDEEERTEPAESSRGPESSIGQLSDEEDSDQEGVDEAVGMAGGLAKVMSSKKDLETIASWGAIYDSAYSSQNAVNDDPTLNFSGYDNSFMPRVPHELHVVKEWVERTCERSMRLNPVRCLELGCGNGMILLRVAPKCKRFIACDLSETACDYVKDIIKRPQYRYLKEDGILEVELGGAHESMRFAHEKLDCIIVNGVSMYFPSAAYLLEVVQTAMDALEPGGKFFLGDVRCNKVINHFHGAAQLYQAAEDMSVDELRQKINKNVKYEKELLVDPELFMLLPGRIPGLAAVEMDIKRGKYHSEFSMYRYDVTFIKADGDVKFAKETKFVDYTIEEYNAETHSMANLTEKLTKEKPAIFAVGGMVDGRLAMCESMVCKLRDMNAVSDTCKDFLEEVMTGGAAMEPVEPEDIYVLGESLGYRTEIFWDVDCPAKMDCVFIDDKQIPHGMRVESIGMHAARHKFETTNSGAIVLPDHLLKKDYELYTNKGQLADGRVGLGSTGRLPLTVRQVVALRDILRGALPEYMIPSAFVGLEKIPTTNNGKVDRKALPAPSFEDMAATAGRLEDVVQPEGNTEIALAGIWRELLGLQEISATDDFFELGGHSLLAMQMLGKIRSALSVSISLTQLINVPLLRDLGLFIEDRSAKALTKASITGDVELSAEAPLLVVVKEADMEFAVKCVAELSVPITDDIRLAGRAWLPETRKAGGKDKFPCLLDVLPYRKSDGTVEVDSATYPYLAGAGFACVRLDTRGTGDSSGCIDDEYSQKGLDDISSAVEWASAQPWCDGQVVLMGVSWGGIAALQAAAFPSPSLAGVIAMCATEERFSDDMHYMGGSLLTANLSWGAWMMHTVAQPPNPKCGLEGPASWLERLEGLQPPVQRWLSRPKGEDKYWNDRSLKKVPGGAPRIPVLALGGTAAGGYVNSVPRLSAASNKVRVAPVKAVVGPWAHQFQHLSAVGPQFGLLQEITAWMTERFVEKEPVEKGTMQFLAYATQVISPKEELGGEMPPGCWLAFEDAVAAEQVCPIEKSKLQKLTPAGAADLANSCEAAAQRLAAGDASVRPVGKQSGAWWTVSGATEELAGDQQVDDALAQCFDGEALTEDMLMLGTPEVEIELKAAAGEKVEGNLVARLCAVAPNGESARLSYGIVNLSAGQWGTTANAVVTLNYTARVVPKGYKLRLALSRDYWPIVFPQPSAAVPQVVVGGSTVTLPLCGLSSAGVVMASQAAKPMVPKEVHLSQAEAVSTLRQGTFTLTEKYDKTLKQLRTVLTEDRGVRRMDTRGGAAVEVFTKEEYSLGAQESQGCNTPGAAHAVEWRSVLTQPMGGGVEWVGETVVTTKMRGHKDHFELSTTVEAKENNKLLFSRQWEEKVPRIEI